MKKWLMLVLIASFSFIFKSPASETPRIVHLLPGLVNLPMINPAIPEDFVAMSPDEHLDWFYWGPKDILQAYFKDPESLSQPILRVRLSHNVLQTGPDQFSDENQLSAFPGVIQQKFQWGTHPVQSVRYQTNDRLLLIAWVGLNSPTQDTLLFQALYPKNDSSNQKAIELWNRLLTETSGLSEQDMFKAHGQDLEDGYTIVSVNGTKLKVTAEKRIKDGKLRVAAIPLEGEVKLKLKKVITGFMGFQWRQGEPLAKVYGTIIADNDRQFGTVIQEQVINVLIRSVKQFSAIETQWILHEE